MSNETFAFDNFVIYPNPATSILNLDINQNATIQRIDIYNLYGQLVYNQVRNFSSTMKLNISNFSNGTYFIKIITNDGNATKNSSKSKITL